MAYSDSPLDFSAAINAQASERSSDLLGRRHAVTALLRLLRNPTLDTPLVVGVYGGWGTGKTSVMRTLQAALAGPDHVDLWFESWIYARQEQVLWRALLLCVVAALRKRTEVPDGTVLQGPAYDSARKAFNALWISEAEAEAARSKLDQAQDSLYRSITVTTKGGLRANWGAAIPLAADLALTALTAGLNPIVAKAVSGDDKADGLASALAKWIKGGDTKAAMKVIEREASEHYLAQVTSLEQFQALFRDLLKEFRIGFGRKLFIFVDDLDRCLPEDAVAALEAIKLFLDLSGCVFILGMDREVVEQGIRIRYKDLGDAGFDARAYLDKVIQVPFSLPKLGASQIADYLKGLQGPAGQAFAECADLFAQAAPPNPRTLKRVLNCLLLTLYLDGFDDDALANVSDADGSRDRVRRLAKVILLQVCHGAAWRAIMTGLCTLEQAEAIARGTEVRGEIDDLTRHLFEGQAMNRLFGLDPEFDTLSEPEVEALLTLARVTRAPESQTGKDEALDPTGRR